LLKASLSRSFKAAKNTEKPVCHRQAVKNSLRGHLFIIASFAGKSIPPVGVLTAENNRQNQALVKSENKSYIFISNGWVWAARPAEDV